MVFEGETFGIGIAIDSFRQVGTRPSANEVLYRSRMTRRVQMRRFSRLHLEHGQDPLIFLFSDSTWMVDRMKILVLRTFFSFF